MPLLFLWLYFSIHNAYSKQGITVCWVGVAWEKFATLASVDFCNFKKSEPLLEFIILTVVGVAF